MRQWEEESQPTVCRLRHNYPTAVMGDWHLGGGSRQPQGLEQRAVELGVSVLSLPGPLFLLGPGLQWFGSSWDRLSLLLGDKTRHGIRSGREMRQSTEPQKTFSGFFFPCNPCSSCFLTFHTDILLDLQAASGKSRFHDGK